ncbi:MAG: hypothetical protein RL325_1601 [Planctomycetota bacterium]
MSSKEHDAWHRKRVETLRTEDGWLTLVGLDFLTDGTHTVGAAPDAAFSYANCAQPIVGTLEVSGDRVRFTPTTGAPSELVADDRGAPSVIRSGSVSFTLVRRNGRLALRVRDNKSPVRTAFAGISCFPYDGAFVIEARCLPAEPGATVAITNVRGFTEAQPVAATLAFELGGQPRTLVATEGSAGRLFVVFADLTNGAQTYGGGRFLDISAPVDGRTTIDFNRAVNPPCSFTAFATCPLPPAANRLPVAVTVGEKTPNSPAH